MLSRLRDIVILLALLAAGALVLLGVLGLLHRRPPGVVVVGSKAFTESIILAEIAAQWLEADGVKVRRRHYLGGTLISFEAVRSGAIDFYPEYTGTGLVAILKDRPVADPARVLARVREAFAERYRLRWLDPLGFNNTYALAMSEKKAAQLNIRRISDLKGHPELVLGFATEFLARPDGWPGLKAHYGLRFRAEPLAMKAGLMYQAAAAGQVDVISAYSTDGRIPLLGLRVLEDDRKFFPPYEAALLVGRRFAERNPRVIARLDELSGAVDTATMQRMNADADFRGRPPRRVAAEFLRAWRERHRAARPERAP